MRRERVLLDPEGARAKRVLTSNSSSAFFPAAVGVGERILGALADGPDYPSQIARELDVYHQTVYYHIRKLVAAGLVRKAGTKLVRGGSADLYTLATDGYAVEFDVRGESFQGLAQATRPRALARFLHEFVSSGELNGWLVVGSPEPHGPNKTEGRDAHYAVQLGFAIGQFVRLPSTFPVKLDVELRNEKLERSNLLIIGGPRTNLTSAELNSRLPVRFSEANFWGSIVDEAGKEYVSEWDALIVKVKNPWNPETICVLAAGLSGAATKAAIIGMTNFSDQLFDRYQGGEYAIVLRGTDLDSDGKVDSVEVLHRAKRQG